MVLTARLARMVPFNEEHLDAAAAAFMRFGRGRHPAALNFRKTDIAQA
jgi:uncharacterized protein with PIN domain